MSQIKILLNDFKRQWEVVGPASLSAVEDVGKRGWYILGEEVASFERALSNFLRLPYAVGVANGMDAIEIALRSAGVGPNDSVLTTPLSAFATTLALIRIGARPIFVDVDSQGLLDLQKVDEFLSKRPEVRTLLPVHLYGRSLDLKELESLKEKYQLLVVEDCAQSIGAQDQGRMAGTVGQWAATSFYPTKNLGAMGDGGALLTSYEAFYEKAKCLRNYGQTAHYVHSELGLNSRLDEMHAALLRKAFLPWLNSWNGRRTQIAQTYLNGIRNSSLRLPEIRKEERPVWHLFPVLIEKEERPSFQEHLSRSDIQTGLHYPCLISDQKALLTYGRFEVMGELRNAKIFAQCEVSLPIHPFLTDSEVQRVIEACNSWIVK